MIIGANDAAVLAGRAGGDWIGENKGEDDFVAVKLSANGTELWRWQVGYFFPLQAQQEARKLPNNQGAPQK